MNQYQLIKSLIKYASTPERTLWRNLVDKIRTLTNGINEQWVLYEKGLVAASKFAGKYYPEVEEKVNNLVRTGKQSAHKLGRIALTTGSEDIETIGEVLGLTSSAKYASSEKLDRSKRSYNEIGRGNSEWEDVSLLISLPLQKIQNHWKGYVSLLEDVEAFVRLLFPEKLGEVRKITMVSKGVAEDNRRRANIISDDVFVLREIFLSADRSQDGAPPWDDVE